jgi:hypothetical protein
LGSAGEAAAVAASDFEPGVELLSAAGCSFLSVPAFLASSAKELEIRKSARKNVSPMSLRILINSS